ncbi:MAG: acetoacetyl-CoA reductase [Gammaproteobacteria bacterium]|nr:acetoacetyl-CoA reductase [Gammaproteobacteria bacterium]MDH3450379.1 acetoacetyl-CoA reductase [Gammaproteobacteria bacterium]
MNDQRIALVTGGTGGIGTAICIALADQGRKVIAGYFPPEKEIAYEWKLKHRADGYDFEIVACDVSDFASSQQMLRDVENTIGAVDILVNCAGITRDKTLRQMTPEQWDAVLRTNLDSAFNVTRHVVESMSERGFGRIVNISSVNGQKGQFGQANYSAAKAGLHGFTKAVAQELAAKGVTVNSVSPGYVKTEMTDAIPEEIRNAIIQQVPMGRMASPAEIAYVVSFLTDDRNTYMTGANLPVNGGMYMT